jgi:hypothetical protein
MHLPDSTSIVDLAMRWQNAGICIVAMWLMTRLKKAWPQLKSSSIGGRLLPFLPLVPTSALVWLPIYDPAPNGGERILLGLVLGAVSGWVYKVITQSFARRIKAQDDKESN